MCKHQVVNREMDACRNFAIWGLARLYRRTHQALLETF
jgi:hypothetical protein